MPPEEEDGTEVMLLSARLLEEADVRQNPSPGHL